MKSGGNSYQIYDGIRSTDVGKMMGHMDQHAQQVTPRHATLSR